MKKIFGIALVLAVVASLTFGSVALADDPTEVTVTWGGGSFDAGGYPVNYGAGYIGATVTAGDDATSTFSTAGNAILGQFTAKDWNDASTGYGVDQFNTSFSADASDGMAQITTTRDDSHAGPVGQFSYNFVSATGGSAQLSMNSTSNWANFYTTNGAFNASSAYTIVSMLGNSGTPGSPTGNWAGFIATGSGTADIDMRASSSYYYGSALDFGWGRWTWKDADATFTGSGTWQVDAVGTNSITVPAGGTWVIPGSGTYGSCAYTTIATFAGSFTVPDYSVIVN